MEFTNNNDENGNPAGGTVKGIGIDISWQNGPLVVDGTRKERNGAFVEDLIIAAIQRIEYYQASRFACEENAAAIYALQKALFAMNERTKRREAQGVEGTHKGN